MSAPQMDVYATVVTADQVTQEVLDIIYGVVDGWYQTGRVDWHGLLDRVEGSVLKDGTRIDFGYSMESPAIKKIKRNVSEYRKTL